MNNQFGAVQVCDNVESGKINCGCTKLFYMDTCDHKSYEFYTEYGVSIHNTILEDYDNLGYHYFPFGNIESKKKFKGNLVILNGAVCGIVYQNLDTKKKYDSIHREKFEKDKTTLLDQF